MRWTAPGLLVVGAVVLVGCSSTSVAGVAVAAGTPPGGASSFDAKGGRYDSCTALSNADITELGLDPATKRNADLGINGDISSGCGWSSATVGVTFIVGTKTISQYGSDTSLQATGVDVGGRASVQLQGIPNEGCGVAIPTQQGVVVVSLLIEFTALKTTSNPCALAMAVATKLEPKLPK